MDEALALATTKQLIKELFNRHEAVLFVTIGKPKNGSVDSDIGRIRTSYHGGAATALGLAHLAADVIKEQLFDEDEDEEEEE